MLNDGAWRAGGYAAFLKSDASLPGQQARQQGAVLGLYAGLTGAGLNAAFGLGYGALGSDTTRSIVLGQLSETAVGRADLTYLQGYAELSKHIAMGQGAMVQPFASLSYTAATQGAFAETGSTADLALSRQSYAELLTAAGLRAEMTVAGAGRTARYFGALAVEKAVYDGAADKGLPDGGVVQGVGIDASAADLALQLGTRLDFTDGSGLELAYRGKFAEGRSSGTIGFTFAARF